MSSDHPFSPENPQVNQSALIGKTALVTGAAKRIGREIALSLAENGVNVAIHFRQSNLEAEKLCTQLKDLGVNSWIFKADFSSVEELHQVIPKVLDGTGTMDFLINSASMFPPDKVQEMEFANLVGNIQVNAWAPFVLAREFGKRASTGKIVNLLDAGILGYNWSHVSYILSKKVLCSLTELMAIELAPEFTVNAVAPGLILPPEGKGTTFSEALLKKIPLQRSGRPVDVASAVLFLLRENYVTGQVIFVDGGSHIFGHKIEVNRYE